MFLCSIHVFALASKKEHEPFKLHINKYPLDWSIIIIIIIIIINIISLVSHCITGYTRTMAKPCS